MFCFSLWCVYCAFLWVLRNHMSPQDQLHRWSASILQIQLYLSVLGGCIYDKDVFSAGKVVFLVVIGWTVDTKYWHLGGCPCQFLMNLRCCSLPAGGVSLIPLFAGCEVSVSDWALRDWHTVLNSPLLQSHLWSCRLLIQLIWHGSWRGEKLFFICFLFVWL